MAALGLLMSLAACSNEDLQSESPDNGKVELNDGEMAVKMSIGGLGGQVDTRAGNNVVLPGEMDIKRLDVYCFVNLNKNATSSEAGSQDSYTLERVYRYEALGSNNDLFITPMGSGYEASFGVLKDKFKRFFVLVANDIEPAVVRTSVVAVSLKDGGEGGDRSTATEWFDLMRLKTMETPLSGNPQLIPPLTMQGMAGRVVNGNLVSEYTKDELENGISATLTRAMTRIDIKNPAATQFKITKVTFNRASNSDLFAGSNGIQVPGATTGGGAYDLVEHDRTTGLDAEFIAGAFYGFPIRTTGDDCPGLEITGTFGTAGEITVEAKFDALIDPNGPTEMKPNTRYVVNLQNSEGNVTATISVADWNDGEPMDSEDVIKKLNSSATLTAVTTDIATTKFEGNILYYYASWANGESTIATIEGAAGENKPIGIILPPNTIYTVTDEGTTGAGNARKFSLKRGGIVSPIFRRETLSLVTYDATNEKQVIREIEILQDGVDVTQLTGDYDAFSAWTANGVVYGNDIETYKIPAFGAANAITYATYNTGGGPQVPNSGIDVTIPADCSWARKMPGNDGDLGISVDYNMGKEERRVVLTLRKYDDSAPLDYVTKNVTLVQEQGLTISPTVLSDVYTIKPQSYGVQMNEIKVEGKTISVVKGKTVSLDISTVVTGGSGLIKYVLFDTTQDWIKLTTANYTNTGVGHIQTINLTVGEYQTAEGTFTVTTCQNGMLVKDTYTVKPVAKL